MLSERCLAILLIAAIAPASCRPGKRSRAGSDVALRLDILFEDLHARGLFDGAVVVSRRSEIVFAKGYGFANAEDKVPFTPDTPADGASLAKTFTAAAVLMLESEGRLDLDAPAQRLLPELPYPEITLRHMLSHSSGLPAYYEFFDKHMSADEVRTNEGLLQVLAKHPPPLAFPPGTRFEYSSFAYDLAALAAARAAGTTVEGLFRTRFFEPLGLTSAFLRPGRFAEFPAPRTRGHRRVAGKLEPNEVFDFEAFHGGSNIYISARDLDRWNVSFLKRPVLDRAAEIKEGRTGLTLESWYHSPDDSAYWYNGHLQGFHDVVFRDVGAGISIVFVSNNTLEPWLHHQIVWAVRDILAGRPPERLALPAMTQIGNAAAIIGSWMMDDGSTSTIEREGDVLLFRSPAGVGYQMFQVDRTSFYVPGQDLVVGLAGDRLKLSSNLGVSWGRR